MVVDRGDVHGEECRDVTLDQVGVGEEDAAHLETGGEGGEEGACCTRVRADQVQVCSDVLLVSRIHPYRPRVRIALEAGVVKALLQRLGDEELGRLGGAVLEDLQADSTHELQAARVVLGGRLS